MDTRIEDEKMIIDGSHTLTLSAGNGPPMTIHDPDPSKETIIRNFHFVLFGTFKSKINASITALKFIWWGKK